MILGLDERVIIWILIVQGIYQGLRIAILRFEVDEIMASLRRSKQ